VQLSRLGRGLVAALLGSSFPASAEPRVELKTRGALYQDSDHTRVTTLAADLSARVAEPLLVNGGYLVDIVSAASVDVVSAATPSFSETRKEATAGALLTTENSDVSAGYRYSVENDWTSHTLSLRGVTRLAQKNTELSLTGSFSANRVGRAEDRNFERELMVYGFGAGVSQLLDPKTVVAAVYEGGYAAGFQSSPYRFVSTADRAFTFLEHDPERRLRHALALWGLRHLFESTSLRLNYRLYLDDWGIVGHTGELRLTRDLSRALSASLRERFYRQGSAWFYQDGYDAPRRYMTRDRELSTFWDSFSGVAVRLELEDVGPFSELGADLTADYFYYRFQNFSALPSRDGVFVSLGIFGSL
jgi:hypothetical protein